MIRFLVAVAAITVAACGSESMERQDAAAPPSPGIGDAPSATFSVPATTVTAGTYEPRDNCGIDPAGAGFRSDLSAAIASRDPDALIKLASSDIKLDFGGRSGPAELRERLAAPNGKGGWHDLAALIQLGCVIYEGRMVMPSFFTREFPDPYAAMIVTGRDVPLRLQADATAASVSMLTWQAVELVGSLQPDEPFQRVKLVTGSEGYVASENLRSVLDYRLIAEKDAREQWQLTAFIAGD